MALYQLLVLKFLWGGVEGSYCAYGYDTYDCSSFPILSIGSIVGIVIGSAVDLSILFGLIKYLCYIREHQLENNRKIHAAPTPVAFVETTSGGYINTAAYPQEHKTPQLIQTGYKLHQPTPLGHRLPIPSTHPRNNRKLHQPNKSPFCRRHLHETVSLVYSADNEAEQIIP
ncbi:uncharacterized protein LOC111106846 [Crassostrea virginica]